MQISPFQIYICLSKQIPFLHFADRIFKVRIQSISENVGSEFSKMKISLSEGEKNTIDASNIVVLFFFFSKKVQNTNQILLATFLFCSINNWTFFLRAYRYRKKRGNKRAYLWKKGKTKFY